MMKRFWPSTAAALICVSLFVACSSDDGAGTGTSDGPSSPSTATPESAPSPSLGAADPAQGSTLGGNLVVLTGTNLDAISEVRFGTASALFRVVSAERVEAVAPAGTSSVDVQVRREGNLSNKVAYAYVAPVASSVASLAPTTGPTVGGNTVVLKGQHFTGASQVQFGDRMALFTVDSDTQISAVAPPGAKDVDVVVTTPGGTSTPVRYAYVEGLNLTFLSPVAGRSSGGASVTLAGMAFTGATSVTFGGEPATSFKVDSDTQISAVAPAAAIGPVQVKVTTPAATSNGVTFEYVAGPALTTLSRDYVKQVGGESIILTGSGLKYASALKFGAVPATSFTVDSDTQITAVTPLGTSPGTVLVVATSPGGISNGVPLALVPFPTMSIVIPLQGSTAGGTVVRIRGETLQYMTEVTFGGVPGTNVSASYSDVYVTAPAHAAGSVTVEMKGTTGSDGRADAFTYVAP